MSILASDVIDGAKAIWREEAAANILSDPNCLVMLYLGLIELRTLRPDAFYDDDGNKVTIVKIATAGDSIAIGIQFLPCLVDYLISRGFQADANLENHSTRSDKHYMLFAQKAKAA